MEMKPERKPRAASILRAEIAWWKEEKRQSKRYSTGWHRCDGAIMALTDVLAKIKKGE